MPMPADLPKRTGLALAAGCGLVSAIACLVVFGMLSEDQVEGPYDGGDLTIGIFVAPLVAAAAAIVMLPSATACRRGSPTSRCRSCSGWWP